MNILFAGSILCLTISASVFAQSTPKIADLGWLAGCWERKDDARKLLVTEQWMSPAGTAIIGMGRTVRDGKTTDWEFMRIEQREDGIYFVAKPKANPDETSFKLISSAMNELAFENKQHDFPQRVIYKIEGAKLTGRIEGTNNGKFLGIDFPMDKVNCVR